MRIGGGLALRLTWGPGRQRKRGKVMEISDPARHAPATLRNRASILAVLRRLLAVDSRVLEIASGTGEHAVFFARNLGVGWQPSDADADAIASINAWKAREAPDAGNLLPAVRLDAAAAEWPVAAGEIDAVVCINMIHIAPWEAGQGLIRGAARYLPPGGVLYLYGPFRVAGHHTAPSNAAFDASLKAEDPRWGVRDVLDVEAFAQANGFSLAQTVEMPANNLSVVFRRKAGMA